MTSLALSNAQLRVLCVMYSYRCGVSFLANAAKGHYWNYRGNIEQVPTPRRDVLLALERRGLVGYSTLTGKEIFAITGKGCDFMLQLESIGDAMNDELLTKREIQAILLAQYTTFLLGRRMEEFRIEVWQKKPRTDAKVWVSWRGIEFYDIGFASMNYRDKWDADYGVEMAVRKAIAGIAKQIAYGQEPARSELLIPHPHSVTLREGQNARTG